MNEWMLVAALLAGIVFLGVRLGRKFAAHRGKRRDARLKSHLDWVNPAPRRSRRLG